MLVTPAKEDNFFENCESPLQVHYGIHSSNWCFNINKSENSAIIISIK